MNSKPLVSVCMITYNHEKFIQEGIEGVLLQKANFNIELVISNDCSTDRTDPIIRALIQEKNNISFKYTFQNQNLGMMANFIFALKECKGKYIALCEGDDYWTDPLKLQKQVDFLEANPSYGICFHKVHIYNQQAKQLEEDIITREVPESTEINELALGNFMHTPSVILRNNFKIPKWFLEVTQGDWALYMIQIQKQKIKKLDEVMAVYRVHDRGVWARHSQEKRDLLTIKNRKLLAEYGDFDVTIKKTLDPEINDSKTVSFLSRLKNRLNKIKKY